MNVQVTIRGRQFNFRTDDDGAKLKSMADDLNERLSSQAGRSKTVDEYLSLIEKYPNQRPGTYQCE